MFKSCAFEVEIKYFEPPYRLEVWSLVWIPQVDGSLNQGGGKTTKSPPDPRPPPLLERKKIP